MAKVSSRQQPPKEPQQQQQQHDESFVAKSPPDIKDFANGRNRMVAQRVVDSSFEGGEEDDSAENRLPVISASEGPIIVTFGGVQLLAGMLMAAFGVLTMLHEASLASVGAGLWGGAMAAVNGLVGVIAGFRGCYQKSDHVSLLAVTVYLALCLVAIGVANLALVLTATGLLRDSQRPIYSPASKVDDEITSVNTIISSMDLGEQLRPNWAPILTNLGLLLITSVECLITIAAAFRCYCYVSRCRNKVHRQPLRSSRINHGYRGRTGGIKVPSPDIASTSYCSTSSSKQKLVRQWLGQQQSYARTQVPFYPPPPPPPPNCCLPPPYYTVDRSSRKTRYPSGSYVSYHSADYNNYLMAYHGAGPAARTRPAAAADASTRNRDRRSWRHTKESRPDYDDRRPSSVDDRRSKKRSFAGNERIRRISIDSNCTTDEIDKTYTGMDREIAEEFISVTMEPKRNLN